MKFVLLLVFTFSVSNDGQNHMPFHDMTAADKESAMLLMKHTLDVIRTTDERMGYMLERLKYNSRRSAAYEIGYLTKVIQEAYRKQVDKYNTSRYMFTRLYFNELVLYLEEVEGHFWEVEHVTNMLHEIELKYGIEGGLDDDYASLNAEATFRDRYKYTTTTAPTRRPRTAKTSSPGESPPPPRTRRPKRVTADKWDLASRINRKLTSKYTPTKRRGKFPLDYGWDISDCNIILVHFPQIYLVPNEFKPISGFKSVADSIGSSCHLYAESPIFSRLTSGVTQAWCIEMSPELQKIFSELSWSSKALLLEKYYPDPNPGNWSHDALLHKRSEAVSPGARSRRFEQWVQSPEFRRQDAHPASPGPALVTVPALTEEEKSMKLKLFRLMYETVRDSDLKVKRAELIKAHYTSSASFEMGYLLGEVTDKFSVMTDIAATLKRLYDEWRPIEHINAYEQIANQAIEVNHLVDIVRAVHKRESKQHPKDEKPSATDKSNATK